MRVLVIKIETSHEVEDALNIFSQDVLHCLGTQARSRSDFEAAAKRHDSTIIDLEEIDQLPADLQFAAYFAADRDAAALVEAYRNKLIELQGYGLAVGQEEISTAYIQDSDWNMVWQMFYHVVPISRHLTVVPEWEEYQAPFADQKLLRLDPGLAFGTGNHQTTRLAMMGLEQTLISPKTVVDVGTGSGILAIAAALLGADNVLATDISDQAITAATANATLNHLTNITVRKTNLLADVNGQFDLIVANILAGILLDLIPQLDEHLQPQGQVIFSGIDYLQLDKITAALTQNGFESKLTMRQGRWVGLIIERKDH